MGKHHMPPARAHARVVMVGIAVASGVLYAAPAAAPTAEAKTHHGVDAPGNPFGASQIAAGYQSTGSSFTTIRVTRSPQGGATITTGTGTGERVSTGGGTIVRSSGGLLSSRVRGTAGITSQSVSGTGPASLRGSGIGGGTNPGTGATAAANGTSATAVNPRVRR